MSPTIVPLDRGRHPALETERHNLDARRYDGKDTDRWCARTFGYEQAGNVVLYATTAENPARVVRFTDDGTAIDMLTPTALAAAATNTAYRGIALSPQ